MKRLYLMSFVIPVLLMSVNLEGKNSNPVSGRIMEVLTDQPGMQFFSGNGMTRKKTAGTGSNPVNTRSGFALETQHFPDSPNHPDFPSTILNPGEKFRSRTIYRFSVKMDK